MARQKSAPPQKSNAESPRRAAISPAIKLDPIKKESTLPEVVVFTSFDGAVREVSDLSMPLGRATALASERAMNKIWGSEQEAKDCQSMFEEI